MFTVALRKVMHNSLAVTAIIASILLFPTEKESVTRPDPKGSADYYVQKYDCWTGTAPKGVIPGHAVVTFPNGKTRYVGSLGVEAALQQLFADADYGLTVHAFCA